MMKIPEDVLQKSINDDWPVWLALHHFLPIKRLCVLLETIYRKRTNGVFGLNDAYDIFSEHDDLFYNNIFVRPKKDSDKSLSGLIYLTKAIFWSNDDGASYLRSYMYEDNIDPTISLALLSYSCGIADFIIIENTIQYWHREEAVKHQGFELFKNLIVECGKKIREEKQLDWVHVEDELKDFSTPLAAIIMKHLADLCLDLDEWRSGYDGYKRANEKLLKVSQSKGWEKELDAWIEIIELSIASCIRTIEGRDKTRDFFEKKFSENESFNKHPLLYLNGSIEALNSIQLSESSLRSLEGVTEVKNNLIVENALLNRQGVLSWINKKYDDSNRWFWAEIRRLTALGAHSSLLSTKYWYAQNLLEDFTVNQKGDGIFLPIRLMIESEDYENSKNINWEDWFVRRYVSVDLIKAVRKHAESFPGVKRQRIIIVLEMYSKWFEFLYNHNIDTTLEIWHTVIDFAKDYSIELTTNLDVSGRALLILNRFSVLLPEKKSIVSEPIFNLFINLIEKEKGFWRQISDPMGMVCNYLDVFNKYQIEKTLDIVLELLENDSDFQKLSWPIVDVSLTILVNESVWAIIKDDFEIKKRVSEQIFRYGMESEKWIYMTYYIQHIDKSSMVNEAFQEKFIPVVKNMLKTSKINSTQAHTSIYSLLMIADKLDQIDFKELVEIIIEIISIPTDGVIKIVFNNAYLYVLQLIGYVKHRKEALVEDSMWLENKLKEIFKLVLKIWKEAEKNPLIFAGFSLPPQSQPNETIVLNWAIATFQLAEFCNHTEQAVGILKDFKNDSLIKTNLLKAIMRESFFLKNLDENTIKQALQMIQETNAEEFYTVILTSILSNMDRIENPELKELTLKTLSVKMFELGPDTLDVGVFTLLLAYFSLTIDEKMLDAYISRLWQADKKLKDLLQPMTVALKRRFEKVDK